jgi:hypothetical protein
MARDVDARFKSQIPFASALALTRTTQDVQREETATLPRVFDRPTPFTMNAIAIKAATKAILTATVYIRPIQAKYLALEIEGGVAMPKKTAIPVPVDIPLNQYGGMPRAIIKQLLRRADTFSGKVHGRPGIFQRKGREVIMLIGWEPSVRFEPKFDFFGIAQRVIRARLMLNFRAAIAQAVATKR